MLQPGPQLESLCRSGRDDIILAAPFIKIAALKRLLEAIPQSTRVCCITRWRPDEIVAGVSDLSIWPLLRDRSGASLWLYPSLHAKYYRVDGHCLVGSANLTGKALGWTRLPNLELLVEFPASDPQLMAFERQLFEGRSIVDDSIHANMSEAVRLLRESLPHRAEETANTGVGQSEEDSEELLETQTSDESADWLPATRYPDSLFDVYVDKAEFVSLACRQTAPIDLAFFDVVPGLSRVVFESYIGSLLLQQPVVRRIDDFIISPRRFEEISALVAALPCSRRPGFDTTWTVQTLMRWMEYFLPTRYIETHVGGYEVFARRSPDSPSNPQ